MVTSPSDDPRRQKDWLVVGVNVAVVCPDCAFTFSAEHVDAEGGGYSCPVCELAAAVGAAAPPTDEQVEAAFKASAYGWSSHQFESRVSFREGVEWAYGLAAGTASAAGASKDPIREALERIKNVTDPPMRDPPHTVEWVNEIASEALAAGASSSSAALREHVHAYSWDSRVEQYPPGGQPCSICGVPFEVLGDSPYTSSAALRDED